MLEVFDVYNPETLKIEKCSDICKCNHKLWKAVVWRDPALYLWLAKILEFPPLWDTETIFQYFKAVKDQHRQEI